MSLVLVTKHMSSLTRVLIILSVFLLNIHRILARNQYSSLFMYILSLGRVGKIEGDEARYSVTRIKRSTRYARWCSSPMAYQYAGDIMSIFFWCLNLVYFGHFQMVFCSYIFLVFPQRYGPPPSYPHLKIPGLNAPIPPGASFGYHPGGWGKPPVDEVSLPLLSNFVSAPIFPINLFHMFHNFSIMQVPKFYVFWISMGIRCMEMFLVFSSKNNRIMRYFLARVLSWLTS